jgi:anti-anti-sigma factor
MTSNETIPAHFDAVSSNDGVGTLTITLHGDLDHATARLLEDALSSIGSSRPAEVVVDCSELTFIGTAGLEMLLAAERRNRPTTRFELRHPSQILRRMLAILRLDLHLRDIRPS